jgi:integrase
MGLYKRSGTEFWWCQFKVKGRPRIRESTGTTERQRAEQYEAKRKREVWEEVRLGIVPTPLWEAAVVDYMTAMPEGRTRNITLGILKWLDPHLVGVKVGDIDNARLLRIRKAKIADINSAKAAQAAAGSPSRWPTAQPSTVNRTLGVIGAVLNQCVATESLQRAPKLPMLKVPEKEPTWGTRERVLKLIALLPHHQIPMVLYALEVGWRRSNVTHLQWEQVSLDRRFAWVTPEDAKAGKGIPTPLTDLAVEVLEAQLGKDRVWVFPYRGHPVTQTSTRAFRKARDAAGLPPTFTWHSLRHTWASWHIQGNTPKHVLQELGGWKSDKMVAVYAHLGAEHLAPYAKQYQGLPRALVADKVGTKVDTVRKKKENKHL